MFKPISKSDDKQQKISKLVMYISNFKVLTDPLKTFRGPPGVRGPPVANHCYMTQHPSLFTLINHCVIAFSFALMFTIVVGLLNAMASCCGSVCSLSHMKQ